MLNRLVWLKDGVEIDFNKLKDIYEIKAVGNKYSLTILKAQFDDEGKYTVKVKDSDANSSANLSVTGNNF